LSKIVLTIQDSMNTKCEHFLSREKMFRMYSITLHVLFSNRF